MASIFKRIGSKFWWIKFRHPRTGKILRESTGFRHDIAADTRRAQELEAQKTLEERQSPATIVGKWDLWVTDFIKDQVSGGSQTRYLTCWRTLRMFLEENKINAPRELTYAVCSSYVKWRGTPNHRQGKYKACKNTAILEFKILRWIMREAVKRDYCSGNPAREVVLKREPRKLFPDYDDQQLQTILKAIETEPEPVRTCFKRSFAIALLQGVRLNETNVNPMEDVSLTGEMPTIRFYQKGGKVRVKPLHPQLVPLFQRLQTSNSKQTYEMNKTPDGRFRWGNRWTKFFYRHNFKEAIPNACFHSLRVTVENVLRQAGIAKELRECYLSHEHGNADVNARYDRIKIKEMVACHEPLKREWLVL